ncbi:hypothetical protein J2X43_003394 [Rhizobium sp. BE258]|nr:hypothetical protein [Rhizobium sp. BE258]
MAKEIKNVGASVRARMLQLAKASGQSFGVVDRSGAMGSGRYTREGGRGWREARVLVTL